MSTTQEISLHRNNKDFDNSQVCGNMVLGKPVSSTSDNFKPSLPPYPACNEDYLNNMSAENYSPVSQCSYQLENQVVSKRQFESTRNILEFQFS